MVQDVVIGQELDKLQAHIKTLTAEIKAKQIQLRTLADSVAAAQATASQDITTAQTKADSIISNCQAQFAPLQAQITQLQTQRASEERAREARARLTLEDLATIKRDKNALLAEYDAKISEAATRLAKIEQAIAACQQKVATL